MSQTLLINIFGPETSGLTAAITSILADYGLEIEALDQSFHVGTVFLGIQAALVEGGNSESAVEAIRSYASDRQLMAGIQICLGSELKNYRVTLLASQINAEQIAATVKTLAEHDLFIGGVKDLSVNPEDAGERTSSCLEFQARAISVNTDSLKQVLLDVSAELAMDVVVQKDSVYRSHRRLAVFDMDSTLIKAEVIDQLAEAAGVGHKVAEITKRAMQGELDFNESFRERLAMLKGLDESVLAGIAEKLPMMEGAERLISSLNKLGYTTAILSGGFTYFAEYLQKKLGIDHIYANGLEIVDGKVTGVVKGDIVNAERKAELLKKLAKAEGIKLDQTIAIGDGANDLLMLDAAGLGVAFHAKPLVRQKARYSVSTLGLDSALYLLGLSEKEIRALNS